MPKDKLDPPSLGYLLNLRREMEMLYRDDDLIIDAMRAVRTLTSKIRLDDKYRITDIEFHDPSVFDEIQRVASSLSLKDPKLTVNLRPSGGQKMADNAANREEWTWTCLRDAGRREAGHYAFRDAVDGACEGAAWSRLVFQNDIWDERWAISADLEAFEYDKQTEEAKKEAGVPFLWSVIDTRTLYPVWSGSKLKEVLIINKRPRNQAFREYRLTQLYSGEIVPEELGAGMAVIDPRTTGPWVYTLEHWDDTYYTFTVQDSLVSSWDDRGNALTYAAGPNGRQIVQFEHGYHRIPFFPAFGYVINWQHGRKIGWGVAESKRWLVEYREYLLTLYAQMAARDTGKVMVRNRTKQIAGLATAGDDRQPQDKEYWEPFQVLTTEDGESIEVLDFGGGGETLANMISYVTQLIEQLMAPRIATDIGGGDPGSGFAIAQIISETQVKEDPIVQNIEEMLNDMTKFMWQLVREKIEETVWVQSDNTNDGWLGMGPEDLTPGVSFKWELDPQRASADLVEHRDLHERMDKRTIGRHQAIEKMNDVNPDDVDDDIELDRIRSTQWYIARHDHQLMVKMQRGDILQQAAEQVIKSGQLPGVGTAAGMQTVGNANVSTIQGMGNGVVPDMGNLAARGNAGAAGPQAIPAGEAGAANNPQGPSGGGAMIGGH